MQSYWQKISLRHEKCNASEIPCGSSGKPTQRWGLVFILVLLLLAALGFLTGCIPSSSPEPPLVHIAPPAWIQGVWYDILEIGSWTFTEDNVIFHSGETPGGSTEVTINYRQAFSSKGITDSVSGDRWPAYRLLRSNGSGIQTFILWTEEEALLGREHLNVPFGWGGDSLNYYRAE